MDEITCIRGLLYNKYSLFTNLKGACQNYSGGGYSLVNKYVQLLVALKAMYMCVRMFRVLCLCVRHTHSVLVTCDMLIAIMLGKCVFHIGFICLLWFLYYIRSTLGKSDYG